MANRGWRLVTKYPNPIRCEYSGSTWKVNTTAWTTPDEFVNYQTMMISIEGDLTSDCVRVVCDAIKSHCRTVQTPHFRIATFNCSNGDTSAVIDIIQLFSDRSQTRGATINTDAHGQTGQAAVNIFSLGSVREAADDSKIYIGGEWFTPCQAVAANIADRHTAPDMLSNRCRRCHPPGVPIYTPVPFFLSTLLRYTVMGWSPVTHTAPTDGEQSCNKRQTFFCES
jgi:hypothetical protein